MKFHLKRVQQNWTRKPINSPEETKKERQTDTLTFSYWTTTLSSSSHRSHSSSRHSPGKSSPASPTHLGSCLWSFWLGVTYCLIYTQDETSGFGTGLETVETDDRGLPYKRLKSVADAVVHDVDTEPLAIYNESVSFFWENFHCNKPKLILRKFCFYDRGKHQV